MIQEIAVSVLWPEFRTWKGPVQDCQQNFCQANHTTGGLGSQAGSVMTTHGQPVSLGFLAIRWWLPTPHSNLISLWPQPTNQRSKWPFLSGIFFAFSVHAKLWQKGFGEKICGMLIQAVEHKKRKKLMSQPYRNKNSQTSGSTNSTQFPETVSPQKAWKILSVKQKPKKQQKTSERLIKTWSDITMSMFMHFFTFFCSWTSQNNPYSKSTCSHRTAPAKFRSHMAQAHRFLRSKQLLLEISCLQKFCDFAYIFLSPV